MLLNLERISKVFLTHEVRTRALHDINLTVARGDFVAIQGPSGSGKSTLLSIMGLLDCATSGRYEIDGTDVSRLRHRQRAVVRNRYVGFVFQNFNLVDDLTVRENIELPLVYRHMTQKEIAYKTTNVLELVGMSHRAGHFPSQLSGGQQQRVAIARALIGEPLLLLADEPTGNLDSASADAIIQMLSRLNAAGTTIVMVTHDSRFANCARRIVGLWDGQVVAGDAPKAAYSL